MAGVVGRPGIGRSRPSEPSEGTRAVLITKLDDVDDDDDIRALVYGRDEHTTRRGTRRAALAPTQRVWWMAAGPTSLPGTDRKAPGNNPHNGL